MWLHKVEVLPAVVLAGLCYLVAGWSGLVVGFLWSTVLVYHGTFCINSLAHVSGSKRYVTGDDSRNNWLLAVFTMGEGWHNNHHAYQIERPPGLQMVGNRSDLLPLVARCPGSASCGTSRRRPSRCLRNEQRLGAKVINRAAEELAARFNSERIAAAIAAALHTLSCPRCRTR